MIEWLSSTAMWERLLVAICAPILLALLGFLWKQSFGRPNLVWVKISDHGFEKYIEEEKRKERLYLQKFFLENRSFRALEEVELWFRSKPSELNFEPSIKYVQENAGKLHVVTIKGLPAKSSIVFECVADYRGDLEKVVCSGREAKRLHRFRPVHEDSVVLPSKSEMFFWLGIALSTVLVVLQVIAFSE